MTGHALRHNERGFTIVELLVASLIMLGITGAIFSLVDPARGSYRAQPEVSDMQQRLRVGNSFLKDDLIMAGAGSQNTNGPQSTKGSLLNFFAPIQPVRIGGALADPLTNIFFRDDAITVFYIPPNAPQATIEAPMPQPSSEMKIGADIGCGMNPDKLCNWKVGMRVLVFDDQGAFDTITLTQVQSGAGGGTLVEGHVQHNHHIAGNELSKRYDIGAQVAQVFQRTFYWDEGALQLKVWDGAERDEAVVDNVVGLRFQYFGEPRPPFLMVMPSGDTITTYGPKPPALGVQNKGNGNNDTGAWPAGENCAFKIDPANGTDRIARVGDLAPGSDALVELTEELLTDGPWCPDENFPTRFDLDLLRVRKVAVLLRVQVASSELRGPAGVLFSRGGEGTKSRMLVPDQEVQFEISPRNFNLSR